MRSLVISLLLSSSVAHGSHRHHRHHGGSGHHLRHHEYYSHGNSFSQISSRELSFEQEGLKKPTFHQLVSLDSTERSTGILDRVKQKFESEEQEKQSQELAKQQQEQRDKELMEAELISKQQKLKTQARSEESLEQAGLIISEIKKGTMDAQQLSQIMLGNIDPSTVADESTKASAQPAPVSLPTVSAPPAVTHQKAPAPVASAPEKHTTAVSQASSSNISSVVASVLQKVNSEHKGTMSSSSSAASSQSFSAPSNPVEKKAPIVSTNVAPKHQPFQSLTQQQSSVDDLEDSISSIAQRVVDEKKRSQTDVDQTSSNSLATKESSDVVVQTKQILKEAQHEAYQQELAPNKEATEEPDEKKKQVQDALENPISQYFADRHPEVIQTAQERHYLTDQI